MNGVSDNFRAETEIIAKLMGEQAQNHDWSIALALDEAPETTGHYGLYDGLDCIGGGVTYNLRQSLHETQSRHNLKRPIFTWLPDTDGSAALWLEGMIRCSICKSVVPIDDLKSHKRRKHE